MGDMVRLPERIGLEQFIRTYPGMRVRPSSGRQLILRGEFEFRADYEGGPVIEDVYELTITVSERYPDYLPVIEEMGGRIPRDLDHHVFSNGALCLGSPLRLHEIAVDTPGLTAYVERALVPFLYAVTYEEETGEPFVFGELKHGVEGLLHDYEEMLGLDDPADIAEALRLLGMKRRKANKADCPCGCGDRLGVCRFNETVRELRDRHGRTVFQQLYRQLHEHLS